MPCSLPYSLLKPAYLCLRTSSKNCSKLNVTNPSLSSSCFLKASVILFKLIQACTNRSKLKLPFFPLSNALNKNPTKLSLNRYPNATNAALNSSIEILPLRSASKRSKSVRQEAKKAQSPQNSGKEIVPLREVSNMRIMSVTVCGSKAVQSPFTRAAESSVSLRWPEPIQGLAFGRERRMP